jgi:hypothetical protein
MLKLIMDQRDFFIIKNQCSELSLKLISILINYGLVAPIKAYNFFYLNFFSAIIYLKKIIEKFVCQNLNVYIGNTPCYLLKI